MHGDPWSRATGGTVANDKGWNREREGDRSAMLTVAVAGRARMADGEEGGGDAFRSTSTTKLRWLSSEDVARTV